MSREDSKPEKGPRGERPEKSEKPDQDANRTEEGASEGGKGQEPDQEPEERQPAWAARRDLIDHTPDFIGSLVSRDQFGVTGGHVAGDVNINLSTQGFGAGSRSVSGQVRPEDIEQVAAVFQTCPSFDAALERLRDDHVVVLRGSRGTGRRSAALMLLHRLGARPIRVFDPGTAPAALPDALEGSPGFLLADLSTSRSRPLLDPHLLGMREKLRRHGGRFVITVETSAVLGDIPWVLWEPPPVEDVLSAHVAALVGSGAWEQLRLLPSVKEFLGRTHQPSETKKFAEQLAAHHRGELDEKDLADFAQSALADRVSAWLTSPEKEGGDELRDKAFLIALAVFDKAPYAIAAELGDGLFVELQRTANPHEPPLIPVFGSSTASRLELAHAVGSTQDEVTEWGPVSQYRAEFQDTRTPRVLLHEVWTVHPSARPALVRWIQQLAKDGRPLVRTRAAAATALLAEADLPSAMAHLIEPWAGGRSYNGWLTAANTLSLASLLEVRGVSRILHAWCTGDHPSRRWTAIRVYGLLGPMQPEKALDALLDAVRKENDEEEEVSQLAEATQLLLLAAHGPVLPRLAPLAQDDQAPHEDALHDHALRAFGLACRESEEGTDRPLVLKWFAHARSSAESDEDELVVSLWRAGLRDRVHTDRARETLQQWVRVAEHDPYTEQSLTPLLAALADTDTDRQRIDHLLRTAHAADGSPLHVTHSLRAAVAAHS
ncbi:hypothetical protein ABZ837_25445 [Streptomyces sp. NPDC047197]|uniref:hypothetical protein n=1 Tax=Streptomyces sp. NPDC047197 TaxID=3155477 RepID=UPI0033F753E2